MLQGFRMTTTQALQNLQDEFKHMTDQAKATQNCLTQLRNAKKEADITKKRQELLASLKTMQESITKLQHEMQESEARLEEALGVGSAQKQGQEQSQTQQTADGKQQDAGFISARNLNPEQQETLYELKASRMGVMKTQNQALKREIMMNKQKQHLLKARHARNESYPGSDTLRAAHALECRVRAAELKMHKMQEELQKSQQKALKYQQLYEESQQGSGGKTDRDTSTDRDRGKSARMTPKPSPNPEQSFVGPTTTINDVVRKNECLLDENESLQREIQRLKRDNSDLILMAKTATASRDSVHTQLSTSEMARKDLTKRFNKLREAYSALSRSKTRQTSGWIEEKKQLQNMETQLRWSEIIPVAPHGSKERFREHRAKENVDLPRQMYPVESYA